MSLFFISNFTKFRKYKRILTIYEEIIQYRPSYDRLRSLKYESGYEKESG